ncbi:MAG: hypothetical protein Q8P02_01825, partial [Candidatus Micrarchaeota archaeon]|nr:hypothetical protein [Candidatus Micrarchaeota archaeon]
VAGAVFILLFLSGLFLLPGWLASQRNINVAIVGDGSSGTFTQTVYPADGGTPYDISYQGLGALLQSDDFKMLGIRGIPGLKAEFLVPGVLDSFDVVVLYGEPVCDRTARTQLADFVKKGGRLVVVGDACTRLVESPDAVGWDVAGTGLSDVMPARYLGSQNVASKLKFYDIDHPIFNGIKNTLLDGRVALVEPAQDALVLAFINSSDVQSGNALYGILEKSTKKGRVVYFAYDPLPALGGGSRNLILNVLLYLGPR